MFNYEWKPTVAPQREREREREGEWWRRSSLARYSRIDLVGDMRRSANTTKSVRRILVRGGGVNALLPLEAKKILKI